MPLDPPADSPVTGSARRVAVVEKRVLQAETPEEQFFRDIILPVYDYALNQAEKLVGKHAAGDAVNQAWLEIWRARDQLLPEQQNAQYFLGIVRHKAVSELRRARRLVEITDDLRDENAAADLPDLPPVSAATKLGNEIEKIIYSMPPMRRDVFLLAKVAKRTRQEIADFFGISVATVSKHIELAMRDIARGLAKMGIRITDSSIQQLLLQRSSETTDE